MSSLKAFAVATCADRAFGSLLFVRLGVGLIFVLAGFQKLFVNLSGTVERFENLGVIAPGFFAPFVGVCELAGGLLVLIGLFTRLAAAPLAIIMVSAIYLTKLGQFADGFLAGANAIRLDGLLLLLALSLVYAGAGGFSVDASRGRGWR